MGRISYVKKRTPIEPDSTFVKLIYIRDINTATWSGAANPNYLAGFKGNSTYQPGINNGGDTANPNGITYYSRSYNNVTVLGSRIKVTAVNTSPNAVRMMYLLPSTDAISSSTDVHVFGTQPYCKKTMLGVSTGAGNTKTLTHYISSRKIWGKPGTTIDDNFSGAPTQDPLNLWRWNLIFHQSSSETTTNVQYNVEITYYCKFWARDTMSAY